MAQPRGHEPFSRFWVVQWGVQSSDASKLQRYFPRVQVFSTKEGADAKVAFLKSICGFGQFKVGCGTISSYGPNEFFNKKAFIELFVSGLAESVEFQA